MDPSFDFYVTVTDQDGTILARYKIRQDTSVATDCGFDFKTVYPDDPDDETPLSEALDNDLNALHAQGKHKGG